MDRLENLRREFNRPMPVSSGYRCPMHNARVSKTGFSGPHTTGQAVDIVISGEDA
ncbi:MAG: D-Ala-D-Ala carboxypeptidase family metallohydrolase, partial [Magnetococcus sp. THC-1_WYH]